MASLPPPSKTIGWNAGPGPTISLLPGQLHFGKGVVLKTLLGSCVALTLWHPRLRIGGMCHFMLPQRPRTGLRELDGRYGDEAVLTLVHCIELAGAKSTEFVCNLYGGADTMPDAAQFKFNIGERNIQAGWQLADAFGFQLAEVDVGDNVPRKVTLDLNTGSAVVTRGAGPKSEV